MYTSCARTIVDQCLEGYNGTIFAYGQSGSGKTHSMLGNERTIEGLLDGKEVEPSDFGIVPRAVLHLFDRIRTVEQVEGAQIEVRLNHYEIYNESLNNIMINPPRRGLKMREGKKEGTMVLNCEPVLVSNAT